MGFAYSAAVTALEKYSFRLPEACEMLTSGSQTETSNAAANIRNSIASVVYVLADEEV